MYFSKSIGFAEVSLHFKDIFRTSFQMNFPRVTVVLISIFLTEEMCVRILANLINTRGIAERCKLAFE